MSSHQQSTTANTANTGSTGSAAQQGLQTTYTSGGLNNSTGREPFEDPTSEFVGKGSDPAAVAGNLHHGTHGATTTTTSTTGAGLTGAPTTGVHSTGSGLGSGHHSHEHGSHGSHTGLSGDNFGSGRNTGPSHQQSAHVDNGGATGTHPASGFTGQGSDKSQYGSNTDAANYDRTTSGAGRTGSIGNEGVKAQYTEGVSGGAANTDKFDVSRETSSVGRHGTDDLSKQHGTTADTDATKGSSNLAGAPSNYGKDAANKDSNDHKASGITRHGDDFTRGDTADSAYKNNDATGLTGREKTTTGVHDNNLQSTGHEKEGLMDKVKNVLGGHSNTTHGA